MRCPKCGGDTKVIDSRSAYDRTVKRRSRECLRCGYRMTTYETISETRGRILPKKVELSLTEKEIDALMGVLEKLCEVER